MDTGATGAIGKAIAERMASRPENEVVLLCRNRERGETVADVVRRRTGNRRLRGELADRARLASICDLAEREPALRQ